MRRCVQCGEEKPMEAFGPRNKSKGTLRRDCKACVAQRTRIWYQANKKRARASSIDWISRNPERAREYGRRWAANNRDSHKAWREAHPDKMAEYKREWAERNPEHCKEIGRVKTRRHKARKAQAPGDGVTAAQWARQIEVYGGRCAYCDMVTTVSEMEHMVPLSRGGEHDICNVVPACRRCNAKKNTMTALEFFIGRRLDRKVG